MKTGSRMDLNSTGKKIIILLSRLAWSLKDFPMSSRTAILSVTLGWRFIISILLMKRLRSREGK